MKQYRYIWNDPKKQWWIAEFHRNQFYYISNFNSGIENIPTELIEDEPTLRQEIKEDVFEKTYYEYYKWCLFWWTDEEIKQEIYRMKQSILKHLWITKDEIKNNINTYYNNISWDTFMWYSYEEVEKLFSDRWLLID